MELTQKIAFALYFVTLGVTLLGFLLAKAWKFRYALFSLALGWGFSTIYIALRWASAGRAPMSNQYESLIFLLWTFIAIYFILMYLSAQPLEWLVPWVALLAIITVGVGSLLDKSISPLVPALQSNWLLIHVSTVMAGYGALALSFLIAVVFLFMGAPAHAAKREALDPLMLRSCIIGFWMLTLGIITGAVWANSAWGSYWSWDPKETWSLITWLFYAMAIHLRRTRGWKHVKFAQLMAGGFVLVLFTYFGVNYLLSGLHSYGRQ